MIARVAGSDCLVQTPCYGIAGDTGESKMNRQVRRALISVSDKTGLVELANELRGLGVDIVSTGGTASALRSAGISTIDVSSVTGFPEMLGGRVKTLHPRIHAGILAVRGDASHMAALEEHRIEGIDLLVVNLYPFEEALSRNESWKEMIENVDVGGPAMIRAAAKNCDSVAVVVDPADYPAIASELRENSGSIGAATRRRLAAKAFSRTAAYDAAIAAWMNAQIGEKLPAYFALGGRLVQNLRYGENPYQSSALYALPGAPRGLTGARQLQGKELSYNNLNDSDAALECLSEFPAGEAAACVIVKHANPCGVGVASSLLEAYQKALRCDPVSAFGGIIALNRRLDRPTAEAIAATFAEVIAVPAIDNDAAAGLAAKKNLRVLLCGLSEPPDSEMLVKMVSGGFLVQDRDVRRVSGADVRTVTKKAPSEQELKDLLFAFRVAKHVKSNAIVFCKNGATVGIGAGQMSRIDAVRIAARKSEDAARVMGSDVPLVRGSVVASDAFFPFADGLLAAVEAGATAVIQPGGSMKDAEIIGAADDAGISMVFTGVRHFRH